MTENAASDPLQQNKRLLSAKLVLILKYRMHHLNCCISENAFLLDNSGNLLMKLIVFHCHLHMQASAVLILMGKGVDSDQ